MRVDGRVELQHWTPDQMAYRLPDVMTVYRRAFLDLHETDPARAEAERAAHARTHVHRPGLRVVAALAADSTASSTTLSSTTLSSTTQSSTSPSATALHESAPLVGIGYGQPGARGQWWHDTV